MSEITKLSRFPDANHHIESVRSKNQQKSRIVYSDLAPIYKWNMGVKFIQ